MWSLGLFLQKIMSGKKLSYECSPLLGSTARLLSLQQGNGSTGHNLYLSRPWLLIPAWPPYCTAVKCYTSFPMFCRPTNLMLPSPTSSTLAHAQAFACARGTLPPLKLIGRESTGLLERRAPQPGSLPLPVRQLLVRAPHPFPRPACPFEISRLRCKVVFYDLSDHPV